MEKRFTKVVKNAKTGRTKTVKYGQKGATISPGSKRGDSYCARSAKIKGDWKSDPNVRDRRWLAAADSVPGAKRPSTECDAGSHSVDRIVGLVSLCSHKSSDYEFVSIGGSCNLSPHGGAIESIEWEHGTPSCIHFSGTESSLPPNTDLGAK